MAERPPPPQAQPQLSMATEERDEYFWLREVICSISEGESLSYFSLSLTLIFSYYKLFPWSEVWKPLHIESGSQGMKPKKRKIKND